MTAASATAGTKVFIAGAPRTGTSILLYAMKSVFGLPGCGESHVMPAFNQMVHSLHIYLESFRAVDKATFDSILLKNVSLDDVRQTQLQYIRAFYKKQFPGGSFVDKTPSPSGVYALPMAEAAFPDARLIVTRRNGIETVCSHVKKFDADFETACNVWANGMKGLTEIRPLCRNLLVVDQFDFSNDSRKVASDIATHLGFPEKAGELERYLATERVERSSGHDWSRRLKLDEVDWKDQQKQLFRARCGQMMSALGYAL